jgi:hypothetical protein
LADLSSLDQTSSDLEGEFNRQLSSRWKRLPQGLHRRSGQQRGDTVTGQESYLHRDVKWYVASLYYDKAKPRNVEVECEQEQNGSKRVVDVFINEGSIHYEVETLFGTGGVPATKLNETVLKYSSNEDIRIVIPNFQCMLFLPDLLRFERYWRKDCDKNISLWTLDLRDPDARSEAGLRRLREVAKEFRNPTESVR